MADSPGSEGYARISGSVARPMLLTSAVVSLIVLIGAGWGLQRIYLDEANRRLDDEIRSTLATMAAAVYVERDNTLAFDTLGLGTVRPDLVSLPTDKRFSERPGDPRNQAKPAPAINEMVRSMQSRPQASLLARPRDDAGRKAPDDSGPPVGKWLDSLSRDYLGRPLDGGDGNSDGVAVDSAKTAGESVLALDPVARGVGAPKIDGAEALQRRQPGENLRSRADTAVFDRTFSGYYWAYYKLDAAGQIEAPPPQYLSQSLLDAPEIPAGMAQETVARRCAHDPVLRLDGDGPDGRRVRIGVRYMFVRQEDLPADGSDMARQMAGTLSPQDSATTTPSPSLDPDRLDDPNAQDGPAVPGCGQPEAATTRTAAAATAGPAAGGPEAGDMTPKNAVRLVPILMYTAIDRTDTDAALQRFSGFIGAAFLVVGLIIVASTLLLVRYAVMPMRRIRGRLEDVRAGRRDVLDGEYPAELFPLVKEINTLINHNRAVVERARTHVGNLAHALKTPLAVLINEAKGDDKLAEVVRRQAEAMSGNVSHYLKRAQQAAQAEVLGARTEVGESIEGIARMLERLYRSKNITIDVDIAEKAVFRGEREDFDELVGNLLENAAKWCKSRVKVAVTRMDDGISVIIDDDGPGLAAEQRAKAMQRGKRLDETERTGSGLGLSIVHDLADIYFGKFFLEDSPLGGLRARLDLPAAPL
jgi:signal transduction histidine kinase